MKADNPFDLLLPAAMAKVAEEAVSIKQRNIRLRLSIWRLPPVFSSQSHSSSISQQPLAQAQCPSAWQNWLAHLLLSGLILCVVCGADLFTSTVLIVVAKASGRITWGQLAKNWLNVYFGNLVGALLFVLLMWLSGEYMTANGQWD